MSFVSLPKNASFFFYSRSMQKTLLSIVSPHRTWQKSAPRILEGGVAHSVPRALMCIYMYTYISSSSSSRFFLLKVFFFVSSSFFLRSLVDFLSLSFVFHFIFFFSSLNFTLVKLYIKREEQKCKAQRHSPPPPPRRERRRARSPPGALVALTRRRGILRTPTSTPA